MNATSLLLEPLDADECAELMDTLVSDAALTGDLRERIAAASAGNPLYVEEMLAMVREHGDGDVVVPPTIHALLQARIDSLDGDVRVVMERGAIEGEIFHRGAVAVLSPDPVRSDVGSHLATLVRKELIRSTAPTFAEDEGFRFRHLLIRDAAYESLPKATRAELHERFADWLAGQVLVEGDEIVGYHLEQSHRYRAELDSSDPALQMLARRASGHLGAAGRGALDRGDFNAGRSLLRRAMALLPEHDEARLALAPELASAVMWGGGSDEGWELLDQALTASDRLTRAHALAMQAAWGASGVAAIDARAAWREEARQIFEEAGDDNGLALYWWSVAWDAWNQCHAEDTAEACRRALGHLQRAGASHGRVAVSVRERLLATYVFGPTPVDEGIAAIHALRAGESGQLAQAWERGVLGRLYAMKGDFGLARELVGGARQEYHDAGVLVIAGGMSMSEAWIELRAGDVGDLAAAEGELRDGLALLQQIGDRAFRPTVAVNLADLLYGRGRYDEARKLCAEARATTEEDDVVNFVLCDAIEGGLLAREGRLDEAEARARHAVTLTEGIDFREARAIARRYLAEVLLLAGRTDEARALAAESLAIREAKGDVTGAARARELFARLGLQVP